jgi:hypothetical protein
VLNLVSHAKENGAGKISGSKREEAAGDWRKLQSEDDQIKETRRACGRYGEKKRNQYTVLVGEI